VTIDIVRRHDAATVRIEMRALRKRLGAEVLGMTHHAAIRLAEREVRALLNRLLGEGRIVTTPLPRPAVTCDAYTNTLCLDLVGWEGAFSALKLPITTYIEPGVYTAQVDDSALEPEPTLWVLRFYAHGGGGNYPEVVHTDDLERVCSYLFNPQQWNAGRIELLRAGEAERYTVFSMDNVRDVLKRVRGKA